MDNTKKALTDKDHSLINILASTSIKIIDRHLLNVRKNQNINKESKGICKVLNITSDLNLEEVLTIAKSLNPKDYPKLFLFIINDQNSSKTEAGHESIKEHLLKFDDTRPQVLQLISEDKNLSSILYKIKPSSKFVKIEAKQDIETVKDFPSFLCTLINGNLQQAVFEVINNLTTLQDSPLILRFLRILDFGDEFFRILILKCAANGSKDDFIAALDAPFDAKEKSLLPDVQKFLSTAFYDEQSDDEDSDDDATIKSSDDLSNKHPKSVLLTAVEHNNQEVIKYLINSRLNLIRNLPFDHQVRISTVAFKTGQLDILCDLLDIADFPFPGYFKLDDSQTNERLLKTIAYRAELLSCIRDEDFEKIDDVAKQNSNLRIAYSINNNSALKEAINSNKLGVYYFLKTFGYTGNDCNEFIEKLSDKEKNKAVRQAAVQKEAIYSNSLVYDQQAVLTLSSNSYIHNKTITKDQETEYFKKIRKWYKNINKVASDVLDVAATCDKLKIIYDFESETVENVSLAGPNSPGITFVSNKWIFIGAQISGRERELEITTTLGQQICYFVLHLVYNNGGRPYYKDDHHVEEIFDNIVKSIDQWSGQPSETIDDECFRLISSVFTSYSPKEFHAELILRVVNILIECQADQTLSTHLQQKYKNLFSFWNDFVVPELKLYLKKDPKVVWLNGCINVYCIYRDMKIDLFAPKDFTEIFKNKIIIISTNVPRLLLIDIHRHLKRVHGCLIDTKNIFLDTKELKSDYVLNEFRQICRHYAGMNVIVDCSSEKLTLIDLAFANKKNNFVFVVANETQKDEIVNVALKVCGVNPELLEINYNWLDLNTKSQKNLLKYKINFQNNEKLSLLEVLEGPNDRNVEDIREMYNSYSKVIDDQLLNFIIDGHKVVVDGIKDEDEMNDIKFDYLFKNTKFIKKEQYEDIEKDKDAEVPQITADELIKITRNKKFVLISDKTGTGKSFALKNISKLIKDKYPTRWTSYIELRLFTKEIKKQKVQPELLTFLIEKVLKLNLNFEVKIFQKLYKDGKVCLIFDEYDTIAPNYVEFVTKLIQEFQFNGGNQMFIGTRDYFEVNLQQKFQIDDIFKLGDFSNENGYELIAKRWILNSNRDLTPKNFDELIKKSPKMEIYVKVAEKMIKKIQTINKQSKFVPRFFHMISEAFKDGRLVNIDVEDPTLSLNRFKIFRTVGIIFYKIWSRDKGEIRNDANISTQGFELNFWQIHQYLAIIIFFPELLEQIYPYYEPTEWIIEEIIACGMVGFKNGKYYFQNVDLRDFFLAEFITKELKRKRLGKIGLEIFVKVLTSSAHRGTQIIINDAVVLDPALLADHGKKFLEFANEFCKMDNLEDFYVNELECLVVMIVDILKSGKYEKVKELLTRTAGKLIKSVKSAEFYLKFEEFLFSFLKSKDLKTLIKEQEVLLRIVQSELDISIFESLVIKLESKFGREFIQKIFGTKSINLEGNILYMMCLSANKEQSKVLKILEIIHKYLKSEIIELMTNCNQNEENILQVCVQIDDEDLLHDLWTKIENSLGPEITKELASKKSSKNQFNVLHYAAFNTKIEVHQTLWTLLVKNFEDLKELKNLILEKDTSGFSYLNHLVLSDNIGIVEFTFSILIELFDPYDYNIILSHKDINEQSLLQIVIIYSTNIEVFQHLWKLTLYNLGSKGKFLQAIKEVDKNSNNLIHHAASFGSNEIFVFIISKLDSMTSSNEFRNILRLLGQYNQNLLQLAAISNGSIEIHKILWETFTKTFDDLLQFSEHVDKTNENVLMKAVQFNSLDVVQLLWTNISKSMKSSEQISYLKKKCINGLTIRDMDTIKPTIRTWIHKLFENKEISTVDSESSEGEFLNDSDVSMDEGDLNNHLRLIKAVKKNNTKVVENILQNNCVDVNYVDARQQKAIDYAWLNYIQNDKSKYRLRKIEKIMTILLKVNSYYPNVLHDFNYESGNEKTQNFIDFTDQIKAIVIQYPNLKYFTDKNNESVLLHILRLQRIVVKNKIDNQMRINVHNPIEEQPVHILQILLKSTIIGADKKGVKCVLNALNSINIIQHFSIVLQIAACMMINITFNFGHEIDQSYVHQEFPQSATFYVGAKSLLYNTNKHKTLGFILNKLILLVLNLVFMNKSRPYPRNDTELEQNYKSIFNSIKLMNDERRKIEGTIKNVFKVCRDDQEAELIAAAMQAVIQCDNSNEMIRIQQHHKKVFKYLSDVVIPECENVLQVLKLITSSRTDIEYGFAFNCLTSNMQNNIIHKIIRFQGRELTILEFEQIVENFRVLLDVEDLKRIIINNEILEIGKPLDHVPDQDIVANKNTEQHLVEEEKIVDQIIEQTEQSKLFILSGLPKSGKIIDKIAAKLKIKYRDSWVILVKISDLVDNLFENRNNFNTSNIPQCLVQILQLNKVIEFGTFYQLYESGKIIILFDEFQSLPDEFINLFSNIFKDFAENLTNMILISS